MQGGMIPARSGRNQVVPSGRGGCHASGTEVIVHATSETGGDGVEGAVASGLWVVEEGHECRHSSTAQLCAMGEAHK